jgi:transposase-like protein
MVCLFGGKFMCPFCLDAAAKVRKKGYFVKRSTRAERIQRYRCLDCGRSFSDQTRRLTYRERKPHVDQPIYRLLNSGMSQRRCAFILGVARKTVARKLVRLGRAARTKHLRWLDSSAAAGYGVVVFDEMETIEHTKLKPLAIAVGVVEGKRLILKAEVSQMPAKGRLAARSRSKYGRRRDARRRGLRRVLAAARLAMPQTTIVKSDQSPRYPGLVRAFFPDAKHLTYKGRRACVVGQGELKAGGFDPLFSLNHTCAMFRDNLKTLSRRTWCTPKRPDRLQALVDIYVTFHNDRILEKDRRPAMNGDPIV